ncbi:hypothetical protein EDD11_005324 [Mortierella claussenii]|nr:hypothetical protein EDD11_005324 [Mortierella claussenii]
MASSRTVQQPFRTRRVPFPQCTFTPVLGASARNNAAFRSSSSTTHLPTTSKPQTTLQFNFYAQSQPSLRSYSENAYSSTSSAASSPKTTVPLTTAATTTTIYMPHQPLAVIEAHLKQLDGKACQKPTFQRWTADEDELLAKAVKDLGTKNWNKISDTYFSPSSSSPSSRSTSTQVSSKIVSEAITITVAEGSRMSPSRLRSPRSCQIHWKFLHPNAFSSSSYQIGAWSAEELELFQRLVNPLPTPESPNNWKEISRVLGTRSAIQCHSQFKTVMHTGTKGKWTEDEVNKLLDARELFGADWQKVAKHVGTRAPGQVRQKWNQFSEDVLKRLQAKRK